MLSELSLKISPEDLTQILQSAFESMLNLEVSWRDAPWFSGNGRLTAVIHLAGNWSGAVLLECSPETACQLAGRFLSIDPPAIADDMVRDVLGELANIIGGNLKSALAEGLHLSMPAIVDGSVPPGARGERLTFECAYGPLWMTVMPES
jgi:chemotaxis protein CheX